VFGSLKALGSPPLFHLNDAEKTRHNLGGRFGRRNFGSPQECVAKYGLKPNRL